MIRGRAGVQVLALGLPLLVGVLVACGDDAPPATPDAAPTGSAAGAEAASRGQALARTRGCAACHGADGQGGLGPPWAGLAGSTVTLADGSTVVADEAYLTESIAVPDAKVVDGYALAMPKTDLSDAEIADLVAYIVSRRG